MNFAWFRRTKKYIPIAIIMAASCGALLIANWNSLEKYIPCSFIKMPNQPQYIYPWERYTERQKQCAGELADKKK